MIKALERSAALKKTHEICLELLIIVDKLCKEHGIEYWIDSGTLLGAVRHGGFIPWDDDLDICLTKDEYDRLLPVLEDFCNNNEDYVLFFSPHKFGYWSECFGKIDYLLDGVFPIKIDIVPVKIFENTPEAIAKDESITNVASVYFRGEPKYPEAILEEHKPYLPKGDNVYKEKDRFYEFYNNYLNASTHVSEGKDYLINFSFNDCMIKRKRGPFHYSDVFPLSKVKFCEIEFSSPGNIEAYLINMYGTSYMQLPEEKDRYTHFTKIYPSKLSKKQTVYLLKQLNYYSVKNLALGKKNRKLYRKINSIKSFLFLSAKLKLRLDFITIFYLMKYAFIAFRKR
ncbi:LicD family protein [Cytophagaceae bacterium ABcell3]|nr:LicD family protein [Cytophagaceae bacterium ABcell3]